MASDDSDMDAPLVMGSKPANDAVRSQLSELGDDGRAPRAVTHYAYPGGPDDVPEQDAATVATALAELGAAPDLLEDGGLIWEETAPVASPEFDERTAVYGPLLRSLGWDYDGWECALVADDPSEVMQ